MSNQKLSRRKMISSSCLVLGGAAFTNSIYAIHVPESDIDSPRSGSGLPFRISMNTSTISGYDLGVEEQIELIAGAGFDGVELWIHDIESYLKQGGNCESLAQKLKSAKLVLENIIGFAPWLSDDDNERKEAIDQLQREMEITAKLGGRYIAAPAVGVKTLDNERFAVYSDRYRTILTLGDRMGIVPVLELWGAGALNQLSDCTSIVIATGHQRATMLLDFYHLYRGGNAWGTLDCLNGARLPVFHINDFPAEPDREQLRDSDRIFPGDGTCPFDLLIPKLYHAGFRGGFSIELFNKEYWNTMDVKTILKKSYTKTYKILKESVSGI